jgi:competence protein ComGC
LVEVIRQSTARTAYRLQQGVNSHFLGFLLVSPLLILLAPLFLLLLIIPKITSQMVV